jgi:hypothetical protein
MDMDWLIGRGRAAVQAHVETTMNGQETEPFEIQALDTVADVLNALHVDWDGEGEFDPEAFLSRCLASYRDDHEQMDAQNEAEDADAVQ